MGSVPKVSILCLAYNQAPFIRQTLDSLLMQKTTFPFEILVNDDHSTDGTTDIIKEYAAKHPGLIVPVFHARNEYAQGKRNFFIRYLLPKARGTYIALCEGDDFWTDPQKLERQVAFLEERPDYALCFHPVRVFFENKEAPDSVYPSRKTRFTVSELIKHNFIQTNSVLYRKADYAHAVTNVSPGDWYLHLYHAQFGKIGFIDRVMAAYRRHPGSMWWDSYQNPDELWRRHGVAHLALYMEMLRLYGGNERDRTTIDGHIYTLMDRLAAIDARGKSGLLRRAVEAFPAAGALYAQRAEARLREAEGRVRAEQQKLEAQQRQGEARLAAAEHDLDMIKESKAWRLRNRAARLLGKPKI